MTQRIVITIEIPDEANLDHITAQGAPPPRPALTPLPAPAAAPPGGGPEWVCPVHGSAKWVPPGVSSRTGQSYDGFTACPERGCKERPRR